MGFTGGKTGDAIYGGDGLNIFYTGNTVIPYLKALSAYLMVDATEFPGATEANQISGMMII